MSLRVYLAPDQLKVSKPGFDATSTDPNQLVFSSAFYGRGGGTRGSLVVPVSPKNSSNVYQPTFHTLAIPPGVGVPIYFVWPHRVGSGIENDASPRYTAYLAPDASHLVLQVVTQFAITFYYTCYRRTA